MNHEPITIPLSIVEFQFTKLIELARRQIAQHDFVDSHAMLSEARAMLNIMEQFHPSPAQFRESFERMKTAYRAGSGIAWEKVVDKVF